MAARETRIAASTILKSARPRNWSNFISPSNVRSRMAPRNEGSSTNPSLCTNIYCSIIRTKRDSVDRVIYRAHDSTILIIINLSRGGLIARSNPRRGFLDRDGAAPRYLHLRQRSALRIETFLSGRYGR